MFDGQVAGVENPQADIPLQHAAEPDDGLIPQTQPFSLLGGGDFGLFGGIDLGIENNLARIIGTERGIHHAFEFAIVFGQRLKLVDRGIEAAMVLVAGLGLVGDGSKVKLKVRHRLNGADQLVDRAAQEGASLRISSVLARRYPFSMAMYVGLLQPRKSATSSWVFPRALRASAIRWPRIRGSISCGGMVDSSR